MKRPRSESRRGSLLAAVFPKPLSPYSTIPAHGQDVGPRLRVLRQAANVGMEAIAAASQLSVVTVGKFERGGLVTDEHLATLEAAYCDLDQYPKNARAKRGGGRRPGSGKRRYDGTQRKSPFQRDPADDLDDGEPKPAPAFERATHNVPWLKAQARTTCRDLNVPMIVLPASDREVGYVFSIGQLEEFSRTLCAAVGCRIE